MLYKLKYSPTLLNLLSGGLAIWMVIRLITFSMTATGTGGEAWGGVALMSLFLVGTLGLTVDFFIQRLTRTHPPKKRFWRRNGLGVIVLLSIFLFDQYQKRHLTIIIPDNHDEAIGVVCDFPDTGLFPRNQLALDTEIQMPPREPGGTDEISASTKL